MVGTIVRLNERGFGFIRPKEFLNNVDDKTHDIFFNVTGVEKRAFDSLKEGDEVRYEVKLGEKAGEKPRAIHVYKV